MNEQETDKAEPEEIRDELVSDALAFMDEYDEVFRALAQIKQ